MVLFADDTNIIVTDINKLSQEYLRVVFWDHYSTYYIHQVFPRQLKQQSALLQTTQ
jgi:hypothetical protein